MEAGAEKNTPLKVVCGGCEQTRPDFKIDRKDFPYYSIEFVAKGRGAAVLGGQLFELSPGTVFSYGPRISQVITADPKQAMTKYFIDFIGSKARTMLTKYIAPVGTAVRVSRPDEIARILDDLILRGCSDSPFKSMMCAALLEYLFYRIAETIVTDRTQPSRAMATWQVCRRHISDNFAALHSLAEIADACAIDGAYLCRLFKRFDTQSPYQYLMTLKMANAAEQLRKTDRLVKEIAFDLGFDDPFHFCRAFKKVFGVSPQTFRNLR